MRPLLAWCACLLLLALGAVVVYAATTEPPGHGQPQSTYTLDWWTVDAGGVTFATGGAYSLGGTAGQPDAGVLSGGGYTLGGGFWRGGVPADPPPPDERIYLPLVTRKH